MLVSFFSRAPRCYVDDLSSFVQLLASLFGPVERLAVTSAHIGGTVHHVCRFILFARQILAGLFSFRLLIVHLRHHFICRLLSL